MEHSRLAGALALLLGLGAAGVLQAQENPKARPQTAGLGVSPTFEGWYENPDGTYTLSFGYVNRNTEEALTIPVGPRNSVSPGEVDQGQPTYFTAGRSYGVFAVTVPAEFGAGDRVYWTLEANGEKYAIPGGLFDSYETDNLHARATDRYPPILVMASGGAESRGPNGARIGPLAAEVGMPLELDVDAWDQQGRDVTLRWYKQRGPGEVAFAEAELPLGEGDIHAVTMATFNEPGEYLLYVRADHGDVRVSAAGLEQCCWTNGYVTVEVQGPATEAVEQVPTFTRDVAPILQGKCQQCHQEGAIAPFSLVTYEDARRYSRRIRDKVSSRIMPPWHVNPHLGIQDFKNNRGLTDDQVQTLVTWIDGGMPRGHAADMPAPPTFPTGESFLMLETLGPPDLVILTDPFTVPAHGNDQWWRPVVETGLSEDRWVRAMEVLPSYPLGRGVTHHFLATAVQEENLGGLLTEWALGKVGEQYAEGTGKLLQAGSKIRFEVHYYPNGTEVPNDQVSLGIWLYPEGYTPEFPTRLQMFNVAPQNTLQIPPHSTPLFTREWVMDHPVRIQSFQAHFHLRGKGASMEAIYPDGRRELLSQIDNFQFNWHNNYIYSDEAAPLLPTGTVLKATMWYDNTENQASNPNPDDFVTWGDRAADEMGHLWIGITDLTEAQYERLAAERARVTTDGGGGR